MKGEKKKAPVRSYYSKLGVIIISLLQSYILAMDLSKLMTSSQLYSTVFIEGICLLLMLTIIVSSYQRWRFLLYASTLAATVAFFSIWHIFLALGSFLIYVPASLLLWIELDQNGAAANPRRLYYLRVSCWALVAFGVTVLICRNIFHIYSYLS